MKIFINIVLSACVIVAVINFLSCLENNKKESKTSDYISSDISAISNLFEVIDKSDNDNNYRYFIYVKNISDIDKVNEVLKNYYNPDKTNFVMIFYFDDRVAGKGYLDNQFSEKISEKKKNILFKHLIRRYLFNPVTKYNSLDKMQ